MRGEVIKFDPASGDGEIVADSGLRLHLSNSHLRAADKIGIGDRVEFEARDSLAILISKVERVESISPRLGILANAYRSERSMWDCFVDVWLHNEAPVSGRGTRWEYWAVLGVVAGLLVSTVLAMVVYAIIGLGMVSVLLGLVLYPAALLFLLFPVRRAAVRRLHDIGCTGWTLGVWVIPPLGMVTMLVIGLISSQPNDNEYGPCPIPIDR